MRLHADSKAREALRALLAGGGYALLTGLALPPVGLGLLALLAPTPLMALALRTQRPVFAGLAAGLATLPLWLIEQSWVAGVTAAGYPLLALYLAIYPAIFVWIGAGARRLGRWAWVGLALAWMGVEFLRGEIVFTGYAWFLTAQPMIDYPIAGLARVAGAYGAGLAVAAFAGLIAQALAGSGKGRRRIMALALSAALLVAGMLAGGMLVRDASGAPESHVMRVGVVQTNVPQSNKQAWTGAQRRADFEGFAQLTRELAQRTPTPDAIVWPETMFPGLTLDPAASEVERTAGLRFPDDGTATTRFYDDLLDLQREINIPMLVGAIGVEGRRVEATGEDSVRVVQDAKFNSVYMIDRGSVAQARYDKLKLTPFGEVMPYISWSDRLERWLLALGAGGMAFDLDAGEDVVRFAIATTEGSAREATPQEEPLSPSPSPRGRGGQDNPSPPAPLPQPLSQRERVAARIVTPICFEITDASLIRRMVFAGDERADVIINLTNDGWFGGSSAGRRQHLQLARWRALETATPVVRAANTGISAAIDARGRLVKVGPDDAERAERVAGTLLIEIDLPAQPRAPALVRVGDSVGWACLAGTLGLALLNLAPKRRRTGL